LKKKKNKSEEKIGVIILAAGASRRMGTPKQLLKIGKKTLLEKTIDTAQKLVDKEIVVVLGANAEKIQTTTKWPKGVSIIINDEWQKGMGTTLKKGVNYFLEQSQSFQAIIVMVCDQPYLTTEKLEELIELYKKTKADIIAAQYENIQGVPALFSSQLFSKLAALNEDEGARKIIKRHQGVVKTINFPEGIYDLDTPQAYQNYLKNNLKNSKNVDN